MTLKHPVPALIAFPVAMHADGDTMESEVPFRMALFKKCVVVSKDICWKGDSMFSIPARFIGRYAPSCVI